MSDPNLQKGIDKLLHKVCPKLVPENQAEVILEIINYYNLALKYRNFDLGKSLFSFQFYDI